MKRFMLAAVLTGIGLALSCSAQAADFSGKWIQYRMTLTEGDQSTDMNFDDMGAPVENRQILEFKDGTLSLGQDMEDASKLEAAYTVDGDTLTMNGDEMPEEMKEAGVGAPEFIFEGDSVVMVFASSQGTMKWYFKKL
jgi:hypothetical protein